MLKYRYDERLITIEETRNEEDIEFKIHLSEQHPYAQNAKNVRRHFENDRDYTDVIFYTYPDRTYRVIVRQDHYDEFILTLMANRLLTAVEWA
ncbi:hypothetical protein [Saccharibacillus alkalitolerans]|uniref:Phage protein n=1 Tax=Saccharibacillus alkalitolerans TaxID=2705290 RepID=A0ABX0F833_9BACL|nr:hypothetical protein [Saccharibacillus alkalitolerans]NGZ77116.1 hypothetical protein [Saccharibacillus alkalitolerans]